MSPKAEGAGARACWFVGATFDQADDQTPRFTENGIWEIHNPKDREAALVKSMQPGDRIAIKCTRVRKDNLPFDNRGRKVSVMAIKAIGTIKENFRDGCSLKVAWEKPFKAPREWFFFTYVDKVWRVLPGNWATDALIGFAFEGKPQDINLFRNHSFWRERFGDRAVDESRFNWTGFYEAVADKLLTFRNRRTELISGIHAIASKVAGLTNLEDRFADGSFGPLKDICPFTAMGIFNRGITDANRKAIANELASLLGVSEPVPSSFDGVPILNNQRSWFFGFAKDRAKDRINSDIDALWEVFAQGIAFAESDDANGLSAFVAAYDDAARRHGVGWNLTMGLYWIRPWSFPTLDSQSQRYIEKKLNIQIGKSGPKGRCSANDYLAVLDALEARFQEDVYPVHSFPELSLAAWHFEDAGTPAPPTSTDSAPQGSDARDDDSEAADATGVTTPPIEPYSIDNILADGCFIDREKLEKSLNQLSIKKNMILQGPPGTGKTWLAKRLALALIGQRDDSKVRAVQFHPNLSYEDFVRGWRPAGDGKLKLVDGPFMEMINAAAKAPRMKYAIVIEEINRGNPAQIFGEMLTLLEADKRTPDEALELSYRREVGERVFIPGNLYVIGTMNIADRSLALVDLALRRRFAIIDLEPILGEPWRNWVGSQFGMDSDILDEIEKRMTALNDEISSDVCLGPKFRVGHSYVTPPIGAQIVDAREWFRQIVYTEIAPLLDEYWFDALDKSQKARARLLEGF